MIEGQAGQFVVVSAPITLFIDDTRGLDALGFVASTLPILENWTNVTGKTGPMEASGRPALGIQWESPPVIMASLRLVDEQTPPGDIAEPFDRLLEGLRRIL